MLGAPPTNFTVRGCGMRHDSSIEQSPLLVLGTKIGASEKIHVRMSAQRQALDEHLS